MNSSSNFKEARDSRMSSFFSRLKSPASDVCKYVQGPAMIVLRVLTQLNTQSFAFSVLLPKYKGIKKKKKVLPELLAIKFISCGPKRDSAENASFSE